MLAHQAQNLTFLGVTPEVLFREDEIPVHGDLEQAARSLYEVHLGFRVRFPHFGRQTGGPRFVVSDYAVLNPYLHRPSPCHVEPLQHPAGRYLPANNKLTGHTVNTVSYISALHI